MAEILVDKSNEAPYRYVFFLAIDIVNGVPEMVHSWYDNEGTSIEEIITNLDKAILIVWDKNKYKTI